MPSLDYSKLFLEDALYPLLTQGLTQLCKSKPENPTVCTCFLPLKNPYLSIIKQNINNIIPLLKDLVGALALGEQPCDPQSPKLETTRMWFDKKAHSKCFQEYDMLIKSVVP